MPNLVKKEEMDSEEPQKEIQLMPIEYIILEKLNAIEIMLQDLMKNSESGNS